MKNKTLFSSRKAYVGCMKALMYLCAGTDGALVLFLVGYVLVKGLPNITWGLLSTSPSYLTERIGILPDLMNTIYIVLATIVIVLPLGVGAAIYLTEYAKNKKLVARHRICRRNALRHPLDHLRPCRYADLLRGTRHGNISSRGRSDARRHEPADNSCSTTQESLKTVPQSYREGAFGLGAGKWRVVRTVVLPRLHRRRNYGLHPERRPHFRRIRRTALYRRLCPRAARNFRRLIESRRNAHRRPLCLRKRRG